MNAEANESDLGLPPSTALQVTRNECVWDASMGHLNTSSTHIDPATGNGIITTRESLKDNKRRFGCVRVVVRCRPLHPDTEADNSTECVHIRGDEVVVCDKVKQDAGRSYRFDRVLSAESDQVTTFAEIAPLVEHVLDGFHATVFAYGQTGSGKTYTMDGLRYTSNPQQRSVMVPDVEGTPVQRHGIIPRVIQLLFDRARERQRAAVSENAELEDSAETLDDGAEYTLRCSFYQIYNEKISDLLRGTGVSADGGEGRLPSLWSSSSALDKPKMDARRKKGIDPGELRVRWHEGDTFRVENLFICTCTSPDEMRAMLFSGIRQKVMRSHLMNHQSSRSHCIFTIYVESRARRNGELLSRSEFSLVDLAGSEKIGHLSHDPSAKLVKESIDINTSLLALGKVITALSSGASAAAWALKSKTRALASRARGGAEQGAGARHIPYRDSKLTMLLKHALGGNSLTIMVACISPSDRYVEETTSTLLYAGRAQNIRNVPHVNEDATTLLIRQLRQEIVQLKAELGYYREMAAKSLVEREGRSDVCKRCGEGVCTTSQRPSEPPSTTAHSTPESAATELEVDQLAESLVAACGMLTNLMQVNGQLRELYDEARDVQNAAKRREAQLNAENLALRERLALLEDIVLQDGEELEELSEDKTVQHTHARNAEGALNSSEQPELARASKKRQKSSRTREDTLTAVTEPSSTVALEQQTHGSARGGEAADGSAERGVSPQGINLSPITGTVPATAKREHGKLSRSASAAPSRSHVWMSTTSSAAPGCASDSGPLTSPVSKIAVAPSNEAEHSFIVRQEVPPGSALSGGASDALLQHRADRALSKKRAIDREDRRQLQYPQKKHKKRCGRLARRLKEYEAHYRMPHTMETYAHYYHEPACRQGAALIVPGVPAIRASEAAAPQVTATLQDMKVTVSKLPKSAVREYVPTSLLQPGMFGCLTFGGGDAEKAPFEQNRSAREARLRAAQHRQRELYRQLHLAAHGPRLEDDVSARFPPSSPSAASPETLGLVRANFSSDRADIAGQREEAKRSRSSFAYPLPLATRSCAPLTTNRTSTVSYCEQSMLQRTRPSSDSMARLMDYLERDR
ncbi:hypothetical protein GH5_01906 [Leishmania sp. Ghana 2012 LV757]|uniref:hypothetical protein n=1 Tax=Leishmania sp. Ghana 2012 LV757 TaxID=2803181 RepID=UPI001B6503C1|nr:hypothetical protein GH5_01906 [Leishmania sp. Ghana 2012 LV757]